MLSAVSKQMLSTTSRRTVLNWRTRHESTRAGYQVAARSLRRNPGFTSVAVLTLALAIGANTAVFTVVNARRSRRAGSLTLLRDLLLIEHRRPQTTGCSVSIKPGQLQTERAQSLFQARLIATFSLVALLLAVVGTYSTLAYSVTERRRELGIRLALGAPPASVIDLVVRRGALLALVGVFVGLLGSLALTRGLQSALYQTSTTDPRVFATSAVLLVIVALLVCIVPARRATRVDPIVVLREI